ncbi:M14 family zinc carboxypeptidase [Oribacterium sp. P6A1]|uniref:M14 family zinc carboxypeptidase n=1 Tax=Oribacterium sp. P6A1 TaxID=1410612 RepID=UPI00068CEA1F|nr:M14 family zinc carboxypeptidase [Oribacterium sp. P6A1]
MKHRSIIAIAAAAVISTNICMSALAEENQVSVTVASEPSAVSGDTASVQTEAETTEQIVPAVSAEETQSAQSSQIPAVTAAESSNNGSEAAVNGNGTAEFGPSVGGTVTSSTTTEFGPMAGGTAEVTSSGSTGYVFENGLGETLPLPSGFHFNNIAAYTYQNMVDDLSVLQAMYPEMKMDVIGTTADNRSLYHVIVGDPNAKHKILVHSGIHAREYIVCQVVMREIASLLEMQQKGAVYNGCSIPELLKNTCIHFVPMVDPDGITLVQGGVDALQTDGAKMSVMSIANMDGAQDMGKYVRTWKNNINGVNLNRNFDANWEQTPSKVDHPSSMNYKGTSAESEVESKALADLTRALMPDRTISYHTQGRVIYWYFGETGNYKNEGYNLASIVHNNTNYSISDSWAPNDAAGFKDWAVQKLDIPSVTIECGLGTSPVEEEQIDRIWAENDGILPDIMIDLVNK